VETEALEVIYANLENGRFTVNSEAEILQLNEKERELHTKVISKKYCPEKDYFIEVLFLEEMLTGIGKEDTSDKINERIETIIEFIENDG
jgi:hypothetical protein